MFAQSSGWDPDPAAPGIYLGSTFSFAACTASGGADQDGVGELCEFQLALAFRPLLHTNQYDEDLTREPAWAARRGGVNEVVIFYALAYHMDGGSDAFYDPCRADFTGSCLSHFGDSEFIELRVKYNATTAHWVLNGAFLSAHYQTDGESSTNLTASTIGTLFYPEKNLGYPRVLVSRDKHANYPTWAVCEYIGGWNGSDSCQGNRDDVRVEVWRNRNLGSSTYPFFDQVNSNSPLIYSGTEYFWTAGKPFCGWDGPSLNHNRANCAGVYGDHLRDRGF